MLPPIIRRQVKRDARGQGLARLSDAERLQRGAPRHRGDLDRCSAIKILLRPPEPIDAVAHGFLANCLRAPVDGPVSREVRKYDNLVAYDKRMTERYWKGWKPA